jgi:hypothetical protein
VERPANEFVDQFLGQQRFQLSLVTRAIQSLLAPDASEQPAPASLKSEPRLRARDSLIAALDLFKQSGRTSLPVWKRDRCIGSLGKQRLLEEITRVLGEPGAET